MTTGNSHAGTAPFSAAIARPDTGPVVVTVTGEIDLVTAEELKEAFDLALEPRPRGLRIDLEGVGFCDSTGRAALIGVSSRCITEEIDLVFLPSPTIRRPARKTGLQDILPLSAS